MATKISKQEIGTASKKKYVVIRSGIRVSEREYDSITDAAEEVGHWQRIIKQWPDGSKITVEEYNDKKHRIY
jgi:hypothetical protein